MGGVEGGGEDGAEGEEVGDGVQGKVGESGGVYLFAEGVERDGGEGGYVVGVDDEERIGGFDSCWKVDIHVNVWSASNRFPMLKKRMRTSTPCIDIGLGKRSHVWFV